MHPDNAAVTPAAKLSDARPGSLEIPRVERPTREEFQERFFKPQQPVVITGAAASWPAFKKWTPEYLRSMAPTKESRAEFVAAPPGKLARFPYWPALGAKFKTAPLDVLMKYIIDQAAKPGVSEAAYIQGMSMRDEFPSLVDDIVAPEYIEPKLPYMTNLWFGTGGIVPLHYDPQQNLLVQITGRKELTLCPPVSLGSFYPHGMYSDAHQTSSVNDIHAPDLARFPRFRDVPQYRAELTPGDMIFIPCYWWHQVHTEALSIAVNLWYSPGARHVALHRYGPRFMSGAFINLAYNMALFAWHRGFPKEEKLVV